MARGTEIVEYDLHDALNLNAWCAATGYARQTFYRVRRELRLTVRRNGREFVITKRVSDRIIEYLHRPCAYKTNRGNGAQRWSRKFDCCQRCERTAYPHKGHGYCTMCYIVIGRNPNAKVTRTHWRKGRE